MPIPSIFTRLTALSYVIAQVLVPLAAGATTYSYPQDTTLQIGTHQLRVLAGSQYDSFTSNASSFTVTLGAGEAFIVDSPGQLPMALENDAFQAVCNVTPAKDNQLTLNGPVTATITPTDTPCSTANASTSSIPSLSFAQPSGGQSYKGGDTVQVFWSTNNGTIINGARLSLSTDGGQTWSMVVANNIMNSGFYSWIVPTVATTSAARLRLDAYYQSKIVAIALSNAFSIQGTAAATPPVVTPPSNPPGTMSTPYSPSDEIAAAASIDDNQSFASTLFAKGSVVCTDGTRIKGATSAAVYFCGRDGKRHAFPNQRVHDSWYQGFSGVVTLSDADLAAIPLGANVTYRPGVHMVKVQTDPKVYAVARNGELRWIGDEWIAKRLYGDNWNTKVDDLSDAFFADYHIGETIGQ